MARVKRRHLRVAMLCAVQNKGIALNGKRPGFCVTVFSRARQITAATQNYNLPPSSPPKTQSCVKVQPH